MKILLLSRYGSLGASSRLRSYQFIEYLSDHEVDIKVSHLLGDDYLSRLYSGGSTRVPSVICSYLKRLMLLTTFWKYDLIWIEYEVFPWMPPIFEKLLSLFRLPYLVDYDDATFHRYSEHRSSVVRWVLGGKIKRVMRYSTTVVAGNEYIAEYAKIAGAREVCVIPTVVDESKYVVKNTSLSSRFVIGWIGSPSTQQYLEVVMGALNKLANQAVFELRLVGASHIDQSGFPVKIVQWTEKTEVSDIREFDVGIMPLFDGPWERGKNGYKLIQYMACGVPVVATPIGVNTRIVEHGRNGYLAGNEQEWLVALQELMGDPSLRERMGRQGRIKFEKQYSLGVTAPILLSVLKKAAGENDNCAA